MQAAVARTGWCCSGPVVSVLCCCGAGRLFVAAVPAGCCGALRYFVAAVNFAGQIPGRLLRDVTVLCCCGAGRLLRGVTVLCCCGASRLLRGVTVLCCCGAGQVPGRLLRCPFGYCEALRYFVAAAPAGYCDFVLRLRHVHGAHIGAVARKLLRLLCPSIWLADNGQWAVAWTATAVGLDCSNPCWHCSCVAAGAMYFGLFFN